MQHSVPPLLVAAFVLAHSGLLRVPLLPPVFLWKLQISDFLYVCQYTGVTPLRLQSLNQGKKGSQTQISFYGLACTWTTVQIRWSADKKGSSESAVVGRL